MPPVSQPPDSENTRRFAFQIFVQQSLSTLESSPIFLDFDDEKEVEEFLKNCQRKNSQLLPISDAKPYDPNEIIKKEKDHENDHLIDVELLNLSVIDFIREDFKWFKRGNWN